MYAFGAFLKLTGMLDKFISALNCTEQLSYLFAASSEVTFGGTIGGHRWTETIHKLAPGGERSARSDDQGLS